jgi:photoactive yellow protein
MFSAGEPWNAGVEVTQFLQSRSTTPKLVCNNSFRLASQLRQTLVVARTLATSLTAHEGTMTTQSDLSPDIDPAILESFLDQLPIGAIMVDDEGIIQRFNRHEEQLSGFSREEVIGESFFSEVAPCTNEIELGTKFRRGISEGNLNIDIEYTFPYPYNRVARDVHIRAFSAEANDSHANFILIEEITSKRELERTNEEMLSGLRAMLGDDDSGSDPDGLAAQSDTGVDDDGTVQQECVCLYADLSSFREVAEEIAPNALFQVLDKRIRHAVQAVHRYGGHIDQITGDAVHAYFVIEHDKEHRPFYDALRAGRDICNSSSDTTDPDDPNFELPFRVGISHGEVVSGRLGRQEFSRPATVGHPLTVARQLASLASTNEIVMSAAVTDRCKDAIGTTEVPEMPIAGLDGAWPIHRLERLDLPS